MNVRSNNEDSVGKEQIELNDSKAHRKDTDNDRTQRDEQPVEWRTSSVAHSAHDNTTLRNTNTSIPTFDPLSTVAHHISNKGY